MGWYSYPGMNAHECIDHQMRGTELIRKSGSWRLVLVPVSGKYVLVHALTRYEDGEVYVKLIGADEHPAASPPKALFNEWLRLTKGQERGQHEQEFIERVRNEYIDRAAVKSLKVGDVFRFTTPLRFTDGTEEDTFVYYGKFRATRKCDAVMVRLPKNFRQRITTDTLI